MSCEVVGGGERVCLIAPRHTASERDGGGNATQFFLLCVGAMLVAFVRLWRFRRAVCGGGKGKVRKRNTKETRRGEIHWIVKAKAPPHPSLLFPLQYFQPYVLRYYNVLSVNMLSCKAFIVQHCIM